MGIPENEQCLLDRRVNRFFLTARAQDFINTLFGKTNVLFARFPPPRDPVIWASLGSGCRAIIGSELSLITRQLAEKTLFDGGLFA
jgi:hypothetical protein